MKIKWLGHASFLITSDAGVRIITDPYQPGAYGAINYSKITDQADIVTVSHEHDDHNAVAEVPGSPVVVNKAGATEAKGVTFKGIASHHDSSGGSERGPNVIFTFNIDGLNVCHLGDLGHQLSGEQLAEIGDVDILFTPVGGTFTVDAAGATDVCQKIKPKVVIPMHFTTDKCALPLSGVDDFCAGKANVKMEDSSEVEFTAGKLHEPTQTVVLKPAC